MATYRSGYAVVGGHENGPEIGGQDSTCVAECFDPETWTWTSLPNMHTKRAFCATAVFDNKLFVVLDSKLFVVHGGKLFVVLDGKLFVVEGADVELSPQHATKRPNRTAAVLGDKLFVVGGIKEDDMSGRFKCLDSAECFDLKTRAWSSLPKHGHHQARNICRCGGWRPAGRGGRKREVRREHRGLRGVLGSAD